METQPWPNGRGSLFPWAELNLVSGLVAVAIIATIVTVTRSAAAFGFATPAPRTTPTPVTLYLPAPGMAGGVAAYTLGSGGALTLDATIGNDNTNAVAVDSAGKIYVLNANNNSISIYAPGADGQATPRSQISGNKTGLASPSGIAVDSFRRIYVSNGQSILIFAGNTNGNVAPLAEIAGPASGLCYPRAIAIELPFTSQTQAWGRALPTDLASRSTRSEAREMFRRALGSPMSQRAA